MILCLSGGIDSVIAYYWLNKPKTIFFDTGNYSDAEKEVVLRIAPDTIIDTSLRFDQIKVDASAFIPNRNLLFAARAMQYDPEVVIAGLKDDLVSDKNPAAFSAMTRVLREINPGVPVSVSSPFWTDTKAGIVEMFIANYADTNEKAIEILDSTLSCYTPIDGKACLSCPSCFRKWNALMANGIKRPFNNEALMDEYYNAAQEGKYIEERNQSIILAIDQYWTGKETEPKLKTFCFDIDGTLTVETEGFGYDVYAERTPNLEVIEQMNGLHEVGHTIILHTARHQEDLKVTVEWLRTHGAAYDQLIMGKPKADYYVDDKMLGIQEMLHG